MSQELTVPWTHWYNSGNLNEFQTSLGSTRDGSSTDDSYNVLYDSLFTPKGGAPFSLLVRIRLFSALSMDS